METVEVNTRTSFTGKKMPQIEVQTTHGVKKIPDDYKGNWIILVCQPGEFDLTCLEEFNAFGMKEEEFKELNAKLIGLSIESPQCKMDCIGWIKQKLKMNISFPIITECFENIESIQGLIHSVNKVRAVSIIDMDGFTRLMVYYPKVINIEVDKILETLKDLQFYKYSNPVIMKN